MQRWVWSLQAVALATKPLLDTPLDSSFFDSIGHATLLMWRTTAALKVRRVAEPDRAWLPLLNREQYHKHIFTRLFHLANHILTSFSHSLFFPCCIEILTFPQSKGFFCTMAPKPRADRRSVSDLCTWGPSVKGRGVPESHMEKYFERV